MKCVNKSALFLVTLCCLVFTFTTALALDITNRKEVFSEYLWEFISIWLTICSLVFLSSANNKERKKSAVVFFCIGVIGIFYLARY